MATYRGMDGALVLGTMPGTPVLEVTNWTINSMLEILPTTVMGDKWATNKPGVASWTATATAFLDYGDTTGQKPLIDAILAAIPTGVIAIINFVLDNDPKHFIGEVIVNSHNFTAALGQIVGVVFNFTGNGPLLAPTWT